MKEENTIQKRTIRKVKDEPSQKNKIEKNKQESSSMQEQSERNKLKLEGLRTTLAVRQTYMSCERSLLSYIRTACVFVSLAFTYLKIASYDQFDTFVIVMFAIGFSFLVYGVVEFVLRRKMTKKLARHVQKEVASVQENIYDDEDL